MDYDLLKEALGVSKQTKLRLRKLSSGYYIYYEPEHGIPTDTRHRSIEEWYAIPFSKGKLWSCKKCGSKLEFEDINFHHIVFRSAGGLNDPDNLLPLCFHCHVGDGGVHRHVWNVEDVIGIGKLNELRERYGVKIKSS